jgi:hypothetical protein
VREGEGEVIKMRQLCHKGIHTKRSYFTSRARNASKEEDSRGGNRTGKEMNQTED